MSEEDKNAQTKRIGDQVLEKYLDQLNHVVEQHSTMIQTARDELQALVEKSNQEMVELAQELNQTLNAEAGVQEEAKDESPAPETAWVKDHLILNPPAAALFAKMFDIMSEVLPEIEKLLRRH